MNTKEVADYLLEGLMKKSDDVIVTTSERRAKQIKFSNNHINATKNWELNSITIFIAKDKKLVTTTLRDISKDSADSTINRLMDFLNSAPANQDYRGIAKGPFSYSEVEDSYDKEAVSSDTFGVETVENAIDFAKQKGIQRSAGVFESSLDKLYLRSSTGASAEEKATRLYLSVRCFKTKHASGHMVGVSRTKKKFDPESVVRKAADIAEMAVDPQDIKPGKYDVVFDYLPFANLLGRLGEAASVFSVESGLSCLSGKIGERVAAEGMNFYDNARLANGYASAKFDAEGVPTSKTAIVENGKLKTYLHNTSTARRHNTQTTANAGLISPEPFNLVLDPGKSTKQEMIQSTNKGLYISNVWYTRFQNYNTGDFSTIPRDGIFLIEDGEITKSVKDIRVSDNLLNIMKKVKSLSKKRKQVFGWEVETPVLTPMALVSDLNITKSGK